MSFLFGDSFDGYPTADLTLKWTNTFGGTAGMSISATAARNGAAGLVCDPGTGFSNDGFTGATGPGIRKTLVPGDPTTCIYRFAFRYMTFSGAALYSVAAVVDNATPQVSLGIYPDGRLYVYRGNDGNQPIGTSTKALLATVWYHVKLLVKIHPTAGQVKLWINAELQFTFNGNTRQTGSNIWTNITAGIIPILGYGGSAYVRFHYDDLNVRDDDDGRFDLIAICLRGQTGNGSKTQYTPLSGTNHGDMIKETFQDGDTTYNQGTTIGQIDNYNMENMPTPSGVAFIQTTEVTRKTDSGDRFVANVLTIGGTDYVGPPQAPTQVYSHILTPYDTSPATLASFTDAEINAMLSGQKITG